MILMWLVLMQQLLETVPETTLFYVPGPLPMRVTTVLPYPKQLQSVTRYRQHLPLRPILLFMPMQTVVMMPLLP